LNWVYGGNEGKVLVDGGKVTRKSRGNENPQENIKVLGLDPGGIMGYLHTRARKGGKAYPW